MRVNVQGAIWLVPMLVLMSGCTSKHEGTGGGGGSGGGSMGTGGGGGAGAGNGQLNSLDPAAMAGSAFKVPLDAALSPDGKTAYFVALDPNQNPAIFTGSATAMGTPTVLASGDPLSAPFGLDVSTDGTQLAIADSSALDATGLDHGCLFTLGTSAAGTPTIVSGTAGYQPRSVVIVQESNVDVAYFTGHDAADHSPGLFKVPLAGGSVTTVLKGAPFSDPSGLAVSSKGDAYVADTSAADIGHAQLLKVSGGAATVVIADMAVGYPAGVALSKDETVVLVSALDPLDGSDVVIRYDLSASTSSTFNTGISAFGESAGLKRARNVDTFIWADSHANGGGTVYVINKQQ